MKYSWMNTTNVSFSNFDPNINHLHLSVVCGSISSTPTREMFLEEWLSSYNVTDINENVNKTRMKRQVDPGISTEQYRSGVTLTYTCGVARRFQNSTDLYDERYVVKYLLNERWDVRSQIFERKVFIASQRSFECQWDKSWTPSIELDPCVWVECDYFKYYLHNVSLLVSITCYPTI